MVQSNLTLRSLLREVDFKKIDSLIHIHDTTNMTALKSIIADIGFPDRKKVGQDGINAVFIILMHTLNDGVNEKENIAEIKPMLVKSVNGYFGVMVPVISVKPCHLKDHAII